MAESDRLPWVDLQEAPRPLRDSVLVYRTQPRHALATDGHRYVIKGPDPVVVAAEALGHAFAKRLGILTPPFALTRDPGRPEDGILFASQIVKTRYGEALLQRDRITNPLMLGGIIAYDTWIANHDRNAYSLLARPCGGPDGDLAELLAIDFEASRLFRNQSLLEVNALPATDWWPSEDLGRFCRQRLLSFPSGTCSAIEQITATDAVVREVAQELVLQSVMITQLETLVWALTNRGSRIRGLVQEVWNASDG